MNNINNEIFLEILNAVIGILEEYRSMPIKCSNLDSDILQLKTWTHVSNLNVLVLLKILNHYEFMAFMEYKDLILSKKKEDIELLMRLVFVIGLLTSCRQSIIDGLIHCNVNIVNG